MRTCFTTRHRYLKIAAAAALAACIPFAATYALAQSVYRSVDASGVVTFSDTQPSGRSTQLRIAGQSGPGASRNIMAPAAGSETPLSVATSRLPPAIGLVVGRYPVSLLTGADCSKCAQGRALLLTRGVPFAETIVATTADLEDMHIQTGKVTLPVLTVGSLKVKEFSAQEWNAFLDAAGYPKTSALPASYKNPPAVAWKPSPRAPAAAPAEQAATQPPMQDAAPAPPLADSYPRLVPLPPPANPANLTF